MQSKLLLAQNNMNNYMNQLYLQNLSNQMLFRQHTLSNFPQNIMNFTNFMNVYPVNPSIDLMKMNFYGNLMKAQNNIFFNKM